MDDRDGSQYRAIIEQLSRLKVRPRDLIMDMLHYIDSLEIKLGMAEAQRTEKDFENAVRSNKIRQWNTGTFCHKCGYPHNFRFHHNPANPHGIIQVMYDRGCDCRSYPVLQPSTWDAVLVMYNGISSDEALIIANKFWGFKEAA